MRIPEYQIYERRSLHWVIRWGVRAVVWSLVSLTLLMGWWAKYVFDNAEPFEGLHSGEHWISLEQLSPEARGFVEVRWERPHRELAWRVIWERHKFDHSLLLGSRIIYWSSLTESQAGELLVNCNVPLAVQNQIGDSFTPPPPGELALEDLLQCTWNPEWELERALNRLVERERITDHRRDELLFKFCGHLPPHLKADPEPQELTDDIRWHCRE